MGISVDSLFCHANWAVSLGGISYPLLQDFHPKGAVAKAYGLYLEGAGITDRATVIIDAGGVVQHASSVTPAGERSIGDLAKLCEEVNAGYQGELGKLPAPEGLDGDPTLYVRSSCGFSLRTLNARSNLHLEDKLPVVNVSEDSAGLAKLRELSGGEKAPCLIVGGQALLESDAIIEHLVTKVTGYWG